MPSLDQQENAPSLKYVHCASHIARAMVTPVYSLVFASERAPGLKHTLCHCALRHPFPVMSKMSPYGASPSAASISTMASESIHAPLPSRKEHHGRRESRVQAYEDTS